MSDKAGLLIDAATGKTLLRFARCNKIRLQGRLALVSLAQALEIWDTRSLRKLHRVPAGSPGLGGVIGSNVYFIVGDKVVHWSLSQGKEVSSRRISVPRSDWPVRVNASRVFVDIFEHEILGLDPHDLTKGWRSYCNSRIGLVSDDGLTCYSYLGFWIGQISNEGEPIYLPERSPTYMYSTRQVPARLGNRIVQGGQLVRSSNEVISPCFFAVDLETRRVAWKRPMIATTPVVVARKFAVIESHGPSSVYEGSWSVYPDMLWGLRSQVIIVDPRTGRTTRKIGKAFTPRNHRPELLATGSTLIVRKYGDLEAYRVR